MKHSPTYKTRKLWNPVILACLLGLSGNTRVQQDAAEDEDELELDRVKVTGSRISRTQVEGHSPVVVLTADDMQREGPDYLQGLFFLSE